MTSTVELLTPSGQGIFKHQCARCLCLLVVTGAKELDGDEYAAFGWTRLQLTEWSAVDLCDHCAVEVR